MTEITSCPNCNTPLKGGIMSSTKLISTGKTNIINEYHTSKADEYCTKCGKDLYTKCKAQYDAERRHLTGILKKLIFFMPVISTHSPMNWDYTILGMVTGQSTTGTGVITEFTSSFTDLFGAQSGRHNRKIRAGEDLCFTQIRKQALDLGGNAVIATDIDYSELGSGKGMIMVCMAGTAVKLRNTNVLSEQTAKLVENLVAKNERLNYLLDLSTE